jgi:hypothetical protein
MSLADAIEEAEAFDLRFCEDAQRCRGARILGASRWTNAFLQPPDPARVELMATMSRERRFAHEYFENFSRPDRQWERVGSAERIRNWLGETRMHSSQFAAAAANS